MQAACYRRRSGGAAGVSLVLSCTPPLLPRGAARGADLLDRSPAELAGLAVAATPQPVSNNVDATLVSR